MSFRYGNRQQQQQQPKAQGDDFWPRVTGFKVAPNSKGTGEVVQFTFNAEHKGKPGSEPPMLFKDFIKALHKAFEESGGSGVRLILPFRQGNGPRGPFQSANIQIVPNVLRSGRDNQDNGGRRSYPPRQAQGYGQSRPQYQSRAKVPTPDDALSTEQDGVDQMDESIQPPF